MEGSTIHFRSPCSKITVLKILWHAPFLPQLISQQRQAVTPPWYRRVRRQNLRMRSSVSSSPCAVRKSKSEACCTRCWKSSIQWSKFPMAPCTYPCNNAISSLLIATPDGLDKISTVPCLEPHILSKIPYRWRAIWPSSLRCSISSNINVVYLSRIQGIRVRNCQSYPEPHNTYRVISACMLVGDCLLQENKSC